MHVPPAHEFPGETWAEKVRNRTLAYICWMGWEDYRTWKNDV